MFINLQIDQLFTKITNYLQKSVQLFTKMSEVKITIGGGYSVKRSLRFYVRFFIHFCCWAVFTCVLAFGGYLWFKLIREDVKAQALLDVKWYTPCYLTNWNFVSILIHKIKIKIKSQSFIYSN